MYITDLEKDSSKELYNRACNLLDGSEGYVGEDSIAKAQVIALLAIYKQKEELETPAEPVDSWGY